MPDRRQYQQQYRQRRKEQIRRMAETMPGQYLRDNPDYDMIMAAIAEELAGEREHA